jgi:hypothetical protein
MKLTTCIEGDLLSAPDNNCPSRIADSCDLLIMGKRGLHPIG